MTFTVSIEPENIRSGMRLLSRLFPEMSPLESDAAVLFTQKDFKGTANPVTGIISYGAPFVAPEKSLQVKLNGNEAGDQPLFSITSTKPDNSEQMVLPTTWGGGGPYMVVSDYMIVAEPSLLNVLREYSAKQQSAEFEPLRSKIARATSADIIFRNDDGRRVRIPTLTVNAQPQEMEMRIR